MWKWSLACEQGTCVSRRILQIPYIQAYIWSWHTWPAQKEATSCTKFYVQDWHWIGKIFTSDPCELILLHWFLRWHLCLFKISCLAEVVTSPCRSVTATSGLTSAGCQPHMSSIWPWSGAPKVRLYDTFLGGLRQRLVKPALCPQWTKGGKWDTIAHTRGQTKGDQLYTYHHHTTSNKLTNYHEDQDPNCQMGN